MNKKNEPEKTKRELGQELKEIRRTGHPKRT